MGFEIAATRANQLQWISTFRSCFLLFYFVWCSVLFAWEIKKVEPKIEGGWLKSCCCSCCSQPEEILFSTRPIISTNHYSLQIYRSFSCWLLKQTSHKYKERKRERGEQSRISERWVLLLSQSDPNACHFQKTLNSEGHPVKAVGNGIVIQSRLNQIWSFKRVEASRRLWWIASGSCKIESDEAVKKTQMSWLFINLSLKALLFLVE